jgi:UDP-N-acetylmuramate dehydrogenase
MTLPILEHVPLAGHTSFRTGGPARWFCSPASVDEFRAARRFAAQRDLPCLLLGNGSNLVISDEGYPGLVVSTSAYAGVEWEVVGDAAPDGSGDGARGAAHVTVQCGALLWDVVRQAVARGYAGIENLAGIPGTLGGGTWINAGAFDQELKDVISEVVSLDRHGNLTRRDNAACEFGYRRSLFCGLDEWILETRLTLMPGDAATLTAQAEAIVARRTARQPLHLPNAGSMFKRPPGNYAGALIEAAGLKGFRMGNVGISDKHANFTVNLGGATSQEIWDLTSEVIRRVHEHSGIVLEREPIFVGAFRKWPRDEAATGAWTSA